MALCRARTVLDHERLAQGFLQALRKEARVDIGRSAGRERHDNLHRPRGIVLRPGGPIDQHEDEHEDKRRKGEGEDPQRGTRHGNFL